MIDVNQIYCDNHFVIHVSQIITLYTLNLYNDVCQLTLKKKKTGGKRCDKNLKVENNICKKYQNSLFHLLYGTYFEGKSRAIYLQNIHDCCLQD